MAKRLAEALVKVTDSKVQKHGPFETKGECENETTLKFDDGKELFVSSTFLKESSPVFKAMLEHDFKEGKSAVIELKEKNFYHVLAFLKCIHPIYYEPITEKNVYNIVPLAEEYQVPLAKGLCRNTINAMITECNEINFIALNKQSVYIDSFSDRLFSTLCELLLKLHIYSFDHEMNYAVDFLSKFPLAMYIPRSNKTRYGTARGEHSFSSLPDHLKGKILYKRIKETGPTESDVGETFLTNIYAGPKL